MRALTCKQEIEDILVLSPVRGSMQPESRFMQRPDTDSTKLDSQSYTPIAARRTRGGYVFD
jgi:hypothetical protein